MTFSKVPVELFRLYVAMSLEGNMGIRRQGYKKAAGIAYPLHRGKISAYTCLAKSKHASCTDIKLAGHIKKWEAFAESAASRIRPPIDSNA